MLSQDYVHYLIRLNVMHNLGLSPTPIHRPFQRNSQAAAVELIERLANMSYHNRFR